MSKFRSLWIAAIALLPNFASAHPPSIVLPDTHLWFNSRDPIPIRRVFLSPQQHNELTARQGQSSLIRMPRKEFERLVQTANAISVTTVPFISEARYTATYSQGSLEGAAEWTIFNSSRQRGVLILDPLRLAISHAQWSDGSKATLYRSSTIGPDDPSKTHVEIAADTPTQERVLRCQWSARPTDDRGDRRFDLRFPTATVAKFELTLPNALSPIIRRDQAILTGPFHTDDPATRRWTIFLSGQNACELTIKSGSSSRIAKPGPTKTNARWTIGEAGAEGTITFEPDPSQKIGDEYRFDLPTHLRVVNVVADPPITWQVESTALHVLPVDPGTLPRISISVLATIPQSGVAWPIPIIRLNGSFPFDDSIQLRIATAVRLVAFEPGDFHLLDSDSTDDGNRVLKLSGTFAAGPSSARRTPVLTFDSRRAQFSVSERSTLAVSREELRLRVNATITAVRGPVREMSFSLPSGYALPQLPNVTTDPAAEIRAPSTASNLVTITLTRPLATGQSTTVTYTLTQTIPPSNTGLVRFAVPATMWQRAERTGSTTVQPSTAFANSSPFVVAYQDFPPPGDVAFRLAERPLIPDLSKREVARPAVAMPNVGSTILPEQIKASIEPHRIVVTLSGLTDSNATRQRIALPTGLKGITVRVSQRWIDRFHIEDDVLTFDSGLMERMSFEVHGDLERTGQWIERFELTSHYFNLVTTHWSAPSDWHILPFANGRTVWMIRSSLLVGFGWLVAGLLLLPLAYSLAGHSLRNSTRASIFILAALAGVFAIQGWACVAAVPIVAVALITIVIWLWRTVPRSLGVSLLLVGFPAMAATSDSATVYFAYGTGSESDRIYALVPQELLDRLSSMSKPTAVITRAEYRGTETSDEAEFEANWIVRSSVAGPQILSIPLTGTKAIAVTLDGRPAFPEPLANGFTVSISSQGEHIVSARFTVPIRRISGERDVHFSGPEVPESTLTFQVMAGSRGISVSTRRGKQSTVLGNPGTITTADLGDGRSVTIRWRPKEGPVVATLEPTSEVAVWDLDEGSAILNSGFVFPASRSGPRYRISIPRGLSVVRVSARAVDSGGPTSLDWTFGTSPETDRILIVTTRTIVENGLALSVTLSPDLPLTRQPTLTFPRAVDRPDPAAVYAIRANGIAVNEWTRTGAIDLPPDAATKAAVKFPELQFDSRPATRTVRRVADTLAISPKLATVDVKTESKHALTWTLGRRSDLFVETKWDASTPAFDSWDIPESLTSVSVRGTELIDWTINGPHMSVWMRTSDEAGFIRWTATMGERSEQERVLPLPRSMSEKATPRVVRIRPATGWTTRLIPAAGITPVTGQTDSFLVEPTVDSIRVLVDTAEIPIAVSTQNSATNVTQTVTPVPVSTETTATVLTKTATNSNVILILLWLGGFALMSIARILFQSRMIPEQIAGWGILGWFAVGSPFLVFVIAGLVYRIARIVK